MLGNPCSVGAEKRWCGPAVGLKLSRAALGGNVRRGWCVLRRSTKLSKTGVSKVAVNISYSRGCCNRQNRVFGVRGVVQGHSSLIHLGVVVARCRDV